MRILFVSGIDGFCHRYQVLHRAGQVARQGGSATIRSFVDPRLVADAASHDLTLLYRVPANAHVAAVIAAARDAGRPVAGAIDDLIFIPDPDLFPDIVAWPVADRDLWMEGVRRYRATLELCDVVLAPTEALRDELDRVGLRAALHRNGVSPGDVALGRAARARCARERARSGSREYGLGASSAAGDGAEAVRIGYFSGTPTHDRDFALVAPVLARLLDEHPGLSLDLVGPLDPGPELRERRDRLRLLPLVPWWTMPDLVADCDVSLAPLDLSRRFAAAKGEIKYLEAALVGVPVVASPARSFQHAIRSGENGRLAATTDDWWTALSELVRDRGLRERLGAAAFADVVERFSEAPRARELSEVLAACVSQGTARHRRSAAAVGPESLRTEPAAYVALEADGFPGALPPLDPASESPLLPSGGAVTQEIRPACDGLVRVDVYTIKRGRCVPGALRLSLFDDAGDEVARRSIPAREAPERGWVALELPVAVAASGRWLSLRVSLDSEERDAGVWLGLATSGGSGGGAVPAARLGDQDLGAPLALRSFAAWPESAPEDRP